MQKGLSCQVDRKEHTYDEEGNVKHGPQPAIGPLEENQLQDGQAEDQNDD